MTQKDATISDIAKALGVDKATVSRAISGKGRISEETRARVQAYIEKNGYRPNAAARSLASSRTYTIGILAPSDAGTMESGFFADCILGICAAASARDYDALVLADERPEQKQLRRVLDNGKAEGVILLRSEQDSPAERLLRERGVPFVVIGPGGEGIAVDNDNAGACRELTKSVLKNCPRKRPALLGGDPAHRVTQSRLAGFRQGCADCGVSPAEDLQFLDAKDGDMETMLDRMLAAGADALFCMDEQLCARAMACIGSRSIAVPDGMQVACFYDGQALSGLSPAVTAIRFDAMALGKCACDRLIQSLAGEDAGTAQTPGYTLAFRQSTKSPAIDKAVSPGYNGK